VVLDGFLGLEHIHALQDEIIKLKKINVFHKASIGKDSLKQINENIRSDSLAWVQDWNTNAALKVYKNKISQLSSQLHQEFYLTLKSFEAHFAVYAPGEFYLKHIDQHKNSHERQVSCILYLSSLYEGDGGELVIYEKDDPRHVLDVISPKQGRLVVFFSSWLYHEVRPANKERYSLTGWIREDEEK